MHSHWTVLLTYMKQNNIWNTTQLKQSVEEMVSGRDGHLISLLLFNNVHF